MPHVLEQELRASLGRARLVHPGPRVWSMRWVGRCMEHEVVAAAPTTRAARIVARRAIAGTDRLRGEIDLYMVQLHPAQGLNGS